MESDFPLVCEGCLGDTPLVKMIRGGANHATCRLCLQPYTQFSWKAGKQVFNKTEVCNACSTVKNLCQTCLKDLKYGLPSQLRDAVLHSVGLSNNSHSSASDVQQRYFMAQQVQLIESGRVDLTEGHEASDRLLRMARAAGDAAGSGLDRAAGARLPHLSARDLLRSTQLSEDSPMAVGSKRRRDDENAIPANPPASSDPPSIAPAPIRNPIKLPPRPPGPPPASAFESKQPPSSAAKIPMP